MSAARHIQREIIDAGRLWRYWLLRASIRLQQKHRKTFLGFMWEPVSMLVVTTTLSIIWSRVLAQRDLRSYFLYLFVGFSVWAMLSTFVNQGVQAFRKHANSISNSPLPLATYLLEDLTGTILSFGLLVPLLLVFVLLFGTMTLAGLFSLAIGVVLAGATAFGFGLTFGIGALFFGDIQEIVKAIMRLAFLATPIIWTIDRLGTHASLVWWNPFYSYLEVFRSGLINGVVDTTAVCISAGIASILLIAGFALVGLNARRIRYQVSVH